MKSKTFFIHINANTLAHYLVRGIFCPAKFMDNRETDIQNIYDSFVLLSDKKWNINSDCSIQIILKENEIARLQHIQNDYFLSLDCFPISRTQKIIFSNKEKGETVIWNINSGAAFVPDWAISYEDKVGYESIELTEKIKVQEPTNKDLEKSIKSFNRLMGGFAFMRVSLLNDLSLDIPENYLSALSFFNKKIQRDLVAQRVDINKKYHNVFTKEYDAFKYLAKDITVEMVTQASRKEKVKLQKKFNTILFKDLDPNTLTYKLAILATYGKGKVKSDHDIVSGLFSELEQSKVEELALVYGLSNGYKALRNRYQGKNGEVDVKFDLNNALQFYIIESLFQYTFNNKAKSETFDYLDLNIINEVKNQKDESLKYAKIFGNYYAYTRPAKESINIQSLIKDLRNVVIDWLKKNDLNIEESKVTENVRNLIQPNIDKKSKSDVITTTKEKKENLKTADNNKLDKKYNKNTNKKPLSSSNEVIATNEDKNLESIDDSKQDTPKEEFLFDNSKELSNQIYTRIQLNKLIGKELKKICKKLGYKGYSKLKVNELREFILDKQNK